MINLKEITHDYLGSLSYVKEIKRNLSIKNNGDIVCLVGPRRVGKTFLMLKKARELLEKSNQVIYVSFDEPFFSSIKVRKFAELVRKEYPSGKVHLFLDEVQEWKNWDFNLRWLHDVKDFYIYISGSSSSLLSSEIPSRLRGRYVSKLVLPLSFKEVAGFEIKSFREKGKLLKHFEEYLKWGGFPEVWKTRVREKVVSILETTFYRDIVERNRIRELEQFKEFFYLILSNYSNRFTYNSLKRLVEGEGLKVDIKTVIKYIKAIENAFVVFTIHRFSFSQKEKILSPKKSYLVDPSFTMLFDQALDRGRKIENLVFLELNRRYGDVNYYITKSGKEVDFYIPSKKLLFEVSMNFDKEHVEKLKEAMQELNSKKAFLIVSESIKESPCELDKNYKNISCMSITEFLLSSF